MLEYVKQILQKVSFDIALFEKELRKCLTYITGDEVASLRAWCYDTFSTGRLRSVLDRAAWWRKAQAAA